MKLKSGNNITFPVGKMNFDNGDLTRGGVLVWSGWFAIYPYEQKEIISKPILSFDTNF